MSKEHKLRFAAIIEQLGVVYQADITDLLLRAYWLALEDVPIDDLERSAAAHIALQKWFPKPCELRAVDAECDAVRAWDAAVLAIHRHGMYRHVDFQDTVINAVVRHLGGWPDFCAYDPAEEQWRRKEFIATYRSLARGGLSQEQSAPLAGLSEASAVKRVNGQIASRDIIVRKIKSLKPIKTEGGLIRVENQSSEEI